MSKDSGHEGHDHEHCQRHGHDHCQHHDHEHGHCSHHGHNHEHGEDCACGGHTKFTVSLEDGPELVCDPLGIFEAAGRSYIALLPEGDDEVLLFRYSEKDGEPVLEEIASDEEYELAGESFYETFEDDDFDDDDLEDLFDDEEEEDKKD